nr:hypothetical protein [Candidatus Woesearchaeota archaeon]
MIPKEEELIAFVKARELANYSDIAKYFDINNSTVSDLINDLVKKKKVRVRKIGGSKVVLLK